MSHAGRHFQRIRAESDSTAAANKGLKESTGMIYHQMLTQLAIDKRQLKRVQSMEFKAERKARLVPMYKDYIDGVISSGAGLQDVVLMTIMVWRIDIGDIGGALQIGRYAIQNDIVMPPQFKRDSATTLAEEVAEYYYNHRYALDNAILIETAAMTDELDMPDEVRAKLYRMIGLSYESNDSELALAAFERALTLNVRIGVKRSITQLKKKLAAQEKQRRKTESLQAAAVPSG